MNLVSYKSQMLPSLTYVTLTLDNTVFIQNGGDFANSFCYARIVLYYTLHEINMLIWDIILLFLYMLYDRMV